jgi:hypothetical protein
MWEKNKWVTADSIRMNDTVKLSSIPFDEFKTKVKSTKEFTFNKKNLLSIVNFKLGVSSYTLHGFDDVRYSLLKVNEKQFVLIYDESKTYYIWEILSVNNQNGIREIKFKVLYTTDW